MLLTQQFARVLCGDKKVGDSVFLQAETHSCEHIKAIVKAKRILTPYVLMKDDYVIAVILGAQLSYKDAAHAISVPLGTIKSRINRARVLLSATTFVARNELNDYIRRLINDAEASV